MSVTLPPSDGGNKYDEPGKEPVAGDAMELSTTSENTTVDKQPPSMQSSTGCGAPSDKADTSAQPSFLPVLPTEPEKGGKGGEGGAVVVSNAEFIAAVFRHLPEGAFPAVCSKEGNPDLGGWVATRADREGISLPDGANNYVNCSSFCLSDDGAFKARKEQSAACHYLMLDDLGTKVPLDLLNGFELSWLIETSPGNFQGGILFSELITDGAVVELLLKALIKAKLCDPGSSGPQTRWARLPVGINGKLKHANVDGTPFRCRLEAWRPEVRYSLQDIVDHFQLNLDLAGEPKRTAKSSAYSNPKSESVVADADDVLTPKPAENPVITALKGRRLYKTPLGSGKHDITCPWVEEHTDALDTGAAYFEPDDLYPVGGFCCQHSHREKYHISNLLEFLGVSRVKAKHKPLIRVWGGNLHHVVSSAEKELAQSGRYFQAGGAIVSVVSDPTTGNPLVIPVSESALTHFLSGMAIWQKRDQTAGGWKPIDPPQRHLKVLHNFKDYKHLPPLKGLARQPYFRESDGELITQPGYDPVSHLFGVFDASQYKVPKDPTKSDVSAALTLLEDLLSEFHFAEPGESIRTHTFVTYSRGYRR